MASEVARDAVVVVLTRDESTALVEQAETQRPPPFGRRGQRQRVWPWPDLDERVLHLLAALRRAPHWRGRADADGLVERVRDLGEHRRVDAFRADQSRPGPSELVRGTSQRRVERAQRHLQPLDEEPHVGPLGRLGGGGLRNVDTDGEAGEPLVRVEEHLVDAAAEERRALDPAGICEAARIDGLAFTHGDGEGPRRLRDDPNDLVLPLQL